MPNLHSNDNFYDKYIAAGNPATPEVVLMGLALDESHSVRLRIAENPHTPEHVLARLVCDDCSDVRAAVIDNPHTPEFVLSRLMNDPSVDVRFALAESHRLPERILFQLLRDENPFVADRASRTYNRLNPVSTQYFPNLPISSQVYRKIQG